MRSDMDHTVLPANYTMPAFTPQPQNITALRRPNLLAWYWNTISNAIKAYNEPQKLKPGLVTS